MKKTIFSFFVLVSSTITAVEMLPGPTVECRFGALLDNGRVGLDEIADYTLLPGTGITGKFFPYEFEISIHRDLLSVEVYLDGEPLSAVNIPVLNVANLPIGVSIFGIASVFHPEVDDFVALQYECIKVF